jgi:hypothetical protein
MRSSDCSQPQVSRIPHIILAALFLSLAAPGYAGVSVEHDREADFSRYTTYAWGEGTPARRPDVQELIVAAVERELAARGLRRVDEGASLNVLTHALVDKHTLEKLADPTYFKFWSGVNIVDPSMLKEGSLVVDLQDAGSETIVWRGLATATVDVSFKKIGRKIDKVVAKMFREFPPPSDGR